MKGTIAAYICSNKPFFTVKLSDGKMCDIRRFSVRNRCVCAEVVLPTDDLWISVTADGVTLRNYYKKVYNGRLFAAFRFPETAINGFILADRTYGMPVKEARIDFVML